VGRGCTLATVSADVARAGGPARAAYGQVVRALSDEIERGLDDPTPLDPRALAALALCVGGLVLSRAVDDPDLADRIEDSALRAVRSQLARSAGSGPGA
jgi:TetR/AcrR family transcriptional repressor of nem operon